MTKLPNSSAGNKLVATRKKFALTAELLDGEAGPVRVLLEGRPAWALHQLVEAGENGLTTLTRPAPRWSAYVHRLRRSGFRIATEHVAHGGAFPGHHGRYRLLSKVRILQSEGGAA